MIHVSGNTDKLLPKKNVKYKLLQPHFIMVTTLNGNTMSTHSHDMFCNLKLTCSIETLDNDFSVKL